MLRVNVIAVYWKNVKKLLNRFYGYKAETSKVKTGVTDRSKVQLCFKE